MPFFTFGQNNSGGSFVTNDSVAEYVIVEADNADAANSIANDIGIYFNGVKDGIDCDCCGDRWYRVDDRDADQEPNIYRKHPAEQKYHCFVYYSTGFVDEFNHPVKHVRAAEQTAIVQTVVGITSED